MFTLLATSPDSKQASSKALPGRWSGLLLFQYSGRLARLSYWTLKRWTPRLFDSVLMNEEALDQLPQNYNIRIHGFETALSH